MNRRLWISTLGCAALLSSLSSCATVHTSRFLPTVSAEDSPLLPPLRSSFVCGRQSDCYVPIVFVDTNPPPSIAQILLARGAVRFTGDSLDIERADPHFGGVLHWAGSACREDRSLVGWQGLDAACRNQGFTDWRGAVAAWRAGKTASPPFPFQLVEPSDAELVIGEDRGGWVGRDSRSAEDIGGTGPFSRNYGAKDVDFDPREIDPDATGEFYVRRIESAPELKTDASDLFGKFVAGQLSSSVGTEFGVAELVITNIQAKKEVGWAVMSVCTLGLLNLLGMPGESRLIRIEGELTIWDCQRHAIASYKCDSGWQRGYMAAYWGYSNPGRAANLAAMRACLQQLRQEVQPDAARLAGQLQACGPVSGR